ncbi:MAG TPA: HIT family protein [Pyrinomonadaceae bacterium]|nr:HIT family protein [Pyrinomonadaceae bacterium]
MSSSTGCLFCRIVEGSLDSPIIFEDQSTLAFLDHRPLFPGHTLLIPKEHFETLADLPSSLVSAVFQNVQMLSRAVEAAMEAEGTFVAMNNRVSQSVPHLHVHVVPRRKKDGLKGFFWPRTKYSDEQQLNDVKMRLQSAISQLTNPNQLS